MQYRSHIVSVYGVCFLIGLDFLFITFLLHFFLSWGIFFVDLKFCQIRFYTLSPCPSWSSNCLQLQTPYISSPNHLHLSSSHVHTIQSLPPLITFMISTPTSFLNYSLVLLYFMETPHINLIICISALSNFNPTVIINR